MEIACKITASIPGTCINLLLMERYKKLIEDTYTEPQNEEILGSYLQIQEAEEVTVNPRQIRQKKRVNVVKKDVKSKNIRQFFQTTTAVPRSSEPNHPSIIEID